MTQKRGLGRGLGALIPGGSTPPAEQPLRTRSHPRTSAEPGESGASTRPVDMFFSGDPTDGQSSERIRAARGDIAGDMARDARERRAASRTPRSSRARGGVAARSVASPSEAPVQEAPVQDAPAGTDGADESAEAVASTARASSAKSSTEKSSTTKSTSNAPATKKPTAKKPTAKKSSASKAAPSKSSSSKSSSAKSSSAKDAASTSGSTTGAAKPASDASSTSSAESASAQPKSSRSTRSTASAKRSGASTKSLAAATSTDHADEEKPQQSAEDGAQPTSKVSAPAHEESVPLDHSAAGSVEPPREDSPVVDVEPGHRFPAHEESVETTPQREDPTDAPDGPAAGTDDGLEPDNAEDDSLDGGDADDQRGLMPVPGAEFAEIPIHEVRENPRNPRTDFDDDQLDELAFSLREVGVLQPVVVRPIPVTDDGESFELVMGERRWRAARRAGLATIPAIIRATSDDDLLRDALLENLHRSQLNPLEEAAAYQQLLEDFGCTQDELADRIGRSRPQISNTLRLMRLPALVQRRLASGALSAGHARALLAVEDPRLQEELAQRVVADGLSVRETERLASRGTEPAANRPAPRRTSYNPRVVDLTSRLSNRLEAPVKIDVGKRKGRITMEFSNLDDLERLAAKIGLDLGEAFGSQES